MYTNSFLKALLRGAMALVLLSVSIASARGAESGVDSTSTGPRFSATLESGFVAVLDHRIQFSRSGTEIDYTKDGGQDVLFPLLRFSSAMAFGRNTIVLLYQPLRLETTDLPSQDLLIDSMLFPKGTPMKFLYNFPYYRISYLRELTPAGGRFDVGVGLTMQIRNATITFESLDGTRYRTNSNIGLVPALKLHAVYRPCERVWYAAELDGIYAPVSYLNGDNNDVTGAILDASLRAGVVLSRGRDAFVNIRYLGGGAEGQSDNYTPPGDGYVNNWLHFLTVSLGVTGAIQLPAKAR